jgi:hypothetical protein
MTISITYDIINLFWVEKSFIVHAEGHKIHGNGIRGNIWQLFNPSKEVIKSWSRKMWHIAIIFFILNQSCMGMN